MAPDGQTIIVIGGSSGMGLATARAAALDGANVTIASSRQERVNTALAELPQGCTGAALDVRDESQVAALFERVGEFDHLAFTAGDAFTPRPLSKLSLSDARYGIGKGTVLRLLRKHGVELRHQSLTPEQLQEAIELYRGGWSLAKVGAHFDRDASFIHVTFKRVGIPCRKPWERP